MAKKAYGRRYAQAAFEIALSRKELELWSKDLKQIAGLAQDRGLLAALESPKFPISAKISILSEKLGNINPLAFNMACLLVVKGRLKLVNKIAEEYDRFLNIHLGIEHAEVTTAVPIADVEMETLAERLSTLTGKKVLLKSRVDRGLIGGIITRFGDKLIDGSVRNRLQNLKRQMEGNVI